VLFFSQYTELDKSSKDNDLTITDEFKPNTWYSLSIRYRVAKASAKQDEPARKRRNTDDGETSATVFVNCVAIGEIKFQEGRFDNYIPRGIAVLGGTKNDVKDKFPVRRMSLFLILFLQGILLMPKINLLSSGVKHVSKFEKFLKIEILCVISRLETANFQRMLALKGLRLRKVKQ